MAIETRIFNKSADIERMVTGLSVPTTYEKFGLSFPRKKPFIIESGKHHEMPSIIPVYSNNYQEIEKIISNGKMKLVEATEIPSMLIAYPSEYEINPHKHSGSDSNYLYEVKKGNDILMLSTLGPGKWTSGLHFHAEDIPQDLRLEIEKETTEEDNKEEEVNLTADINENVDQELILPIIEEYEIVYGMAILHQVEGDKGYAMPNAFSVEPGVLHRMQGGPKGAIFSIRMKHAAIYPPDLRHIHV